MPTLTDAVPAVDANSDFAGWIECHAGTYRAMDTPRDRWLAMKLAELAQLVRWTGAGTPEDHDDRIEACEREMRERLYNQGLMDGRGVADPQARTCN
jgi:hypothetical protein